MPHLKVLLDLARSEIAASIESMRPKRFYLSHRACPMCGAQMIYRGSIATLLDSRYARTCTDCRYADPIRVTMIREL